MKPANKEEFIGMIKKLSPNALPKQIQKVN